MAPRVTVFIDYQNAHNSAHRQWCPHGEELHKCTIDPVLLAERVVAKRAPGGVLEAVRVYRGQPDTRRENLLGRKTQQQAAIWNHDERVTMIRRMLKYPDNFGQPDCYEPAREKGIDVSLAVDLVRMALQEEYDVGIVFSRDEDLLPAVELVFDLKDVHVEAATWEGSSRLRLKYRPLYCHKLSEQDFNDVKDTRFI